MCLWRGAGIRSNSIESACSGGSRAKLRIGSGRLSFDKSLPINSRLSNNTSHPLTCKFRLKASSGQTFHRQTTSITTSISSHLYAPLLQHLPSDIHIASKDYRSYITRLSNRNKQLITGSIVHLMQSGGSGSSSNSSSSIRSNNGSRVLS